MNKGYEIDDSKNSTKVVERSPLFPYAEAIDHVLESRGGVKDILELNLSLVTDGQELGNVLCLMNDWRVIYIGILYDKGKEIKGEELIEMVQGRCEVFEDIDEWGNWATNVKWHNGKKGVEGVNEVNKKRRAVLSKFFEGDIESMQREMKRNIINDDDEEEEEEEG